MWSDAVQFRLVDANHDMPERDCTKAQAGRHLNEETIEELATELYDTRNSADAAAKCQDA
ncbi:MAG: hypothetical protein V4568_13750 [Pseudomonadota bacterium]